MTAQRYFLLSLTVAAGLAVSAVSLTFPVLAGQEESVEIVIPGGATFEHTGEQLAYRTQVTLLGNWQFVANPSGSLEAHLSLVPDTPAGFASWEGQNATEVGPTALYVARAGTSEDGLRQWRQAGGRSGNAPELVIPLATAKPDQQTVQAYQNDAPVTAAVFARRCDGDDFLHYGKLILEAGTLLFAFRLDETGEVHADISASELVLDLTATNWEALQDACDPDDALLVPALDGFSQDLHGTSEPRNPPADSLTADFEFLSRNLKTLAFQERIDEKSALHLMGIAERARTALQRARSEQTRHHLDTFRHRVRILDRQGRLGAKDAQLLTSGAGELRDRLAGLRDLPLPEPDPALATCPGAGSVASCPDTLSSCAFTVLHVDAGTSAEEPDGTRARPFSTLGAALARAEVHDACGVSLRVEPGRYEEDLSISRHTKILGNPQADGFPAAPFLAGSVANGGPHFLEVRNFVLSAPDRAPSVGLSVTHPCASTRLDNVVIVGYRGLGLHQEGGSFAFVDLEVADIRAVAGRSSAGTGVLLNCGAAGHMVDITLRGNESAGFIAAGSGTEIEAFDLVVAGTRAHPDYLARRPTGIPWGAIHVRDDASLAVRGFRVAHNWVAGIRAETGADSFFEQGMVGNTLGLTRVAPGSSAQPGGVNLMANRWGQLKMWDFVSTRADMCGALVANGGELDLRGRHVPDEAGRTESTSEVSHSAIGACVAVPGYDVSRLAGSEVAYRNNDINLDSVDFHIPEPFD